MPKVLVTGMSCTGKSTVLIGLSKRGHRIVSPDDLTGRARIRDAALEEFAERGVRGATVRSIAARAGVSPALVQHHFGTKERLRSECDDYVVGYL